MTHYHVNGRNGLETFSDPEVAKGSADIWQHLGVGCTAFPCNCRDNKGPRKRHLMSHEDRVWEQIERGEWMSNGIHSDGTEDCDETCAIDCVGPLEWEDDDVV